MIVYATINRQKSNLFAEPDGLPRLLFKRLRNSLVTLLTVLISRRLPGFKKFSYAERLKRSNLPSLELRRLHCDLLRCYKIMFGHVDINFDDMFELRMSTDTRRHKYKLFKKRNTSSLRSSFYTERVVNVWNHLPSDVKFNTLSAFERTMKLVDFTDYLKCF